ncbi:MAG: hypothetical protein ABS81_01235 [Pseudonocardia sp. SCN 72-86]|nr:MAG: hypothetical protein ABS81_01235 [Pseudonocardia sp. SCN 72-86]
MFCLEDITRIHDELGSADTLPEYLRALRDIGVRHYDSFITDGHSEYHSVDGRTLASDPAHSTFPVGDTCDRDAVLAYMTLVEQGGVGYEQMSQRLAELGMEKWTFDTVDLTITYSDKTGRALLSEQVGPTTR